MRRTIAIGVMSLLATGLTRAAITNSVTYTANGAGLSIDAVGLPDSTPGVIQADIPTGAQIYRAYLYSASVWEDGLSDVVFEGTSLTSDGTSRLDVDARQGNDASENRWDVTTPVTAKVGGGSGLFDFGVTELGYLDGEVLAVIYSVPTEPVKTAMIFDGELATDGDSVQVNLSPAFDGSDVVMSLGISFGYQPNEFWPQFTNITVNGERITSSAGGQDDGFDSNGGLITAGGIGDSIANPPDANAGDQYGPRYDDELYNLAPFLTIGDNVITIETYNPSANDNVFFMGFVASGRASTNGANGVVPTPGAFLLAMIGAGGIGRLRRWR
ncbi:MAG: PEP-CTERM sorting domain-containing protein, partial [Phycisphaerales bacterium]